MIKNGQFIVDLGGHILIEERKGQVTEYYSVGLMGGRPMACFAHDAEIEPIAKRHGVTLEIDRDTENGDQTVPAPVKADGTQAALYAFVLDVFRNGTLSCFSPPRKTKG